LLKNSAKIITRENADEIIEAITVNGKLIVESPQDYMKLCRLARAYSKAVKAMLKYVKQNTNHKTATKKLYDIIPNYMYLETAYKQAKLIWEGLRANEGEIAHIRRLWIASRGERLQKGNRNIKLIPYADFFLVKIRYPWDRTWIYAKAYFGERYLPLLCELCKLSSQKQESYGAIISFRSYPRIHIQVPLWLYLKHFSSPEPRGYGLLAGFDLNSDRINMVVIDGGRNIITTKTEWFEEATVQGISRDKATNLRLKALLRLIRYAREIGVDYLVFENLSQIKSRKYLINPTANRKITRFAKRELLEHALLMGLRYDFMVVLISPRKTSRYALKIRRKLGLDRHTASAYIIALRGLRAINIYGCLSNV